MKWFLVGASTCTAAFSIMWILKLRSDKRKQASHLPAKQSLGYNALSKALDIAFEMSGVSGHGRAMFAIACGEELLFEFIEPSLLRFFGYGIDDNPPKSVYDLLPQGMT